MGVYWKRNKIMNKDIWSMEKTNHSFDPKTGAVRHTKEPHIPDRGWEDGKNYQKWLKGSNTPGTIKKDEKQDKKKT